MLDVSAKPLGDERHRSRMVLLHDVTSQRARVRELTNFAGMVAHDLRGPLTVARRLARGAAGRLGRGTESPTRWPARPGTPAAACAR